MVSPFDFSGYFYTPEADSSGGSDSVEPALILGEFTVTDDIMELTSGSVVDMGDYVHPYGVHYVFNWATVPTSTTGLVVVFNAGTSSVWDGWGINTYRNATRQIAARPSSLVNENNLAFINTGNAIGFNPAATSGDYIHVHSCIAINTDQYPRQWSQAHIEDVGGSTGSYGEIYTNYFDADFSINASTFNAKAIMANTSLESVFVDLSKFYVREYIKNT